MVPEDQPAGEQPPTSPVLPGDPDGELWEDLLLLVDERRVVPVVGRDLVTVTRQGQDMPLDVWLAGQLALQLGVPAGDLSVPTSLNEVASRYLAGGGEPERIYSRICKICRAQAGGGIPEPLKKLADIRSFDLFLSTTFDPLLAQAIDAVRFDGAEGTEVLAFSPRERIDVPGDLEHLEQPIVYHLLGRLSAVQDYVVTEEDALEFVHSLQASGLPPNLSSALDERTLLIIGCSFPAWLVRFFLRASRRHRLLLARGKTDFVVDARAGQDASLVRFLQAFKTRTQLFRCADPVAFVHELHRRWQERAAQHAAPVADAPAVESQAMSDGAVFVSYASEDRAAAQGIVRALDEAGMDVWFDRQRLGAGDAYESKIKRNIERCSLFLPLLSRRCVTPEKRFFRREWKHAQYVAETVRESARFIVPAVLDDLPTDHEDIPETFRAIQWEALPGGRVTPEFVALVRQLYRDHQVRTAVRK